MTNGSLTHLQYVLEQVQPPNRIKLGDWRPLEQYQVCFISKLKFGLPALTFLIGRLHTAFCYSHNLSRCYCSGLVRFLFYVLRSVCLPPPLFPPSPAPSLCVRLWAWQQQQQQQQQNDTPVLDQLITLRPYLPGLSTISVLIYYIPYSDFRVL